MCGKMGIGESRGGEGGRLPLHLTSLLICVVVLVRKNSPHFNVTSQASMGVGIWRFAPCHELCGGIDVSAYSLSQAQYQLMRKYKTVSSRKIATL